MTPWAIQTDMLLRREVTLAENQYLIVGVAIDNDVQVWVNGVEISGGMKQSEGAAVKDRHIFVTPPGVAVVGANLVAIRARDRGSFAFIDSRLTAGQEENRRALAGTVTFDEGETTKTLTISVTGDAIAESDESFTVTLSNPIGATIATGSANGTIRNDETSVAITASSAIKAEGNSGNTAFTFTVTRSGLTNLSSSVDFVVAGSGTSGADAADFGGTLPSGRLTFSTWEYVKTITINVSGDTTSESSEDFIVMLSNPTATTITTASAKVTILDDDSYVSVAATNATRPEENHGNTDFTFTINRTGNTDGPANVSYVVSGIGLNPAKASDFGGTFPTGTVSFASNETSKLLTIGVSGDGSYEADETFAVTLSNVIGAVGGTLAATGTIQNDDSRLSIAGVNSSVLEGEDGLAELTFTVTRSGPAETPVSVNFSVAGSGDSWADANDFGGSWPNGSVELAAGESSKTFTINVGGDTAVEFDEGFTVTLSNPVNADLGTTSASGTIWNDDLPEVIATPKLIPIGSGASSPDNLMAVGDTLFFFATDGSTGRELWKVGDVAPRLASNDEESGSESATSNDASRGATSPTLVKDIQPGSADGPIGGSRMMAAIGNTLFFVANDGVSGAELWKSDGTSDGTVLVTDLNVGPNGSLPQQLTVVNGTLFFTADNGVNGRELWKSDGTAAGTVMVKDIVTKLGTSSDPTELINVAGSLFFTASDVFQGRELWKSDGTAAGTILIKDIYPGISDSAPQFLTNVNGQVFFSAASWSGRELWKSDGTSAGTVLVKDIRQGSQDSAPQQLVNLNGQLWFSANEGINGRELWKSDGTSAGTVLVKNVMTGTGHSNPANMTLVGSAIFFTATDGVSGRELWKSDGTDAGTSLVKDIFAGSDHSNPTSLLNVNGRLWFRAIDALHGRRLWTTDGTANHTNLISNETISQIADPAELTVVGTNGLLFFSADDGVLGRQLWSLDTVNVPVDRSSY